MISFPRLPNLLRGSAAASLAVLCLGPAAARAANSDFGIDSVSASLSSYQAGAHADLTTAINFKLDPANGATYAAPRDIDIDTPAGVVGQPAAFPTCDVATLINSVPKAGGPLCPQDSQVGLANIFTSLLNDPNHGSGHFWEPIYNLPAGNGAVARIGFPVNDAVVIVDLTLRSDGDYGIRAEAHGNQDLFFLDGVETTLWGVPGDPSHDAQRKIPAEWGCPNACDAPGGARSSGIGRIPFLTNPASCGPLETKFAATSYPEPDVVHTASAPMGTITGCESIAFNPSMSIRPTSSAASSPSGLDVTLDLPQTDDPDGTATAELRDARVTLPAGLTLNASAADGLSSCTAAQAGLGTTNAPACPDAAKIGTATFDSPALARPIQGAIYQRTPSDGKLLRIWLTADDLGVRLKLPGELTADPVTGQIVSTFTDNPQLPLRQVVLQFAGGARGVLSTPVRCGTYATTYSLTPWSGTPPVTGSSAFTIDQNCAAADQFTPTLRAGLANPTAGGSSTFSLQLTRPDGQQNLTGLGVVLPPGLLAKLAGIPLCPDQAAATGSCDPASQVGRTVVGTGVGPYPLYLPQAGKAATAVYLAGPYKGAPFSMVIKVPAQAGPFDLGTVVVRAALSIDPIDAHATIVSDPLPQIIQGIPVSYRDVRVIIDRPGFMRAPTSCEPMAIQATATSAGPSPAIALQGAVGYAAGAGQSAALTTPFQVGGCDALGFKPKLQMALSGAGKKRRQFRSGGHPVLTAALTPRTGDANLKAIKVALPLSLALDPDNAETLCEFSDGLANRCPAQSIVGHATAITPLLDQPLTGPVYFVKGVRFDAKGKPHKTLPTLLLDLNGQVALQVRASSAVDRKKRLVTTFPAVPDAPITGFTLNIDGGKHGILVVTGSKRNLCSHAQKAAVTATGHNAVRDSFTTTLARSCGKAKKKAKAKHKRRAKHTAKAHRRKAGH